MRKVTGSVFIISMLLILGFAGLSLAGIHVLFLYDLAPSSVFFLSYGTVLVTTGYVCLIAAVVDVLLRGGAMRWWFVLPFVLTSFHILSGQQLLEVYPAGDHEAEFGIALMATILSFGSVQILSKADFWMS